MYGFEDAILPAVVMVGLGLGALITSKAQKRRKHRRTHR